LRVGEVWCAALGVGFGLAIEAGIRMGMGIRID
jgi:hypothetical protein